MFNMKRKQSANMKSNFFLLLFICPILNCYSQTSEQYYQGADLKFGLRDYQGAIEQYNKAIELDPTYAKAYSGRALSKCMLQNFQSALADYNKVIEIKPLDAESYYNRGLVRNNLQEYVPAMEDYTKAIELIIIMLKRFMIEPIQRL